MGNGIAHAVGDTINKETRVPLYVVVGVAAVCVSVALWLGTLKSDIQVLQSEQSSLKAWVEKMDRKLDRLLEKP